MIRLDRNTLTKNIDALCDITKDLFANGILFSGKMHPFNMFSGRTETKIVCEQK